MTAVDLKSERLNRGMSIEEIAAAVEVPVHVWRYAENTGRLPRPANALKIASYFGRTVTAMWPAESVEEEAEL